MHTSSARSTRSASALPTAPVDPAVFGRPVPPPVAAVEVPALPAEPVEVDGAWELAYRQGDTVRVATAPTAEEARELLRTLLGY